MVFSMLLCRTTSNLKRISQPNSGTSSHLFKQTHRAIRICGVLAACFFSVYGNSNELPNIRITFTPSVSELDKQTILEIKKTSSLRTVQSLSESIIHFPTPVHIVFGALDGPLYDPETNQIEIPYSFWREMVERFSSDIAGSSDNPELHDSNKAYALKASAGALLHTLLHELGHAYIALNEIPILGKEEDAADSFANILMLNYVDTGDYQAIHAATLFAIEDQQIDSFDDLDFIDEHSLDIQRYFYSLCLVYGSDPDKHKTLFQDLDSDVKTEREDICIEEFERVTTSWQSYFEQQSEQ